MTHEEAKEALRRVDGVLGLVEPAGDTWLELVPPESAVTTVPLVDLLSPLPHASRVELAKRVLATGGSAGMLAVIERADAMSMVPDLPIVGVMPTLRARLRAGRREVARLVDRVGESDESPAAELALVAAGDAVWPPLRDRLDLLLGEADPSLFRLLDVIEASHIGLGPVLDLVLGRGHLAREVVDRLAQGERWRELASVVLERMDSVAHAEHQRQLAEMLFSIALDASDRRLPASAAPVLRRALERGDPSFCVPIVLLAHGWACDEALAAIRPLVEALLGGDEGEYEGDIELSTIAYAIGEGGVRTEAAFALLARIEAQAHGHLLKNVATALRAMGTAPAVALLRQSLARHRASDTPWSRSQPEFWRGVEARLVIELARAEGGSAREVLRELWDQDGGVFAELEICAALPWFAAGAREEVLAALEAALRGDRPFRAYPLLRALGPDAAPLVDAVRGSQGSLRERLDLLFDITADPNVGRELLVHDPESVRRPALLEIAIADATAEDERRRAVALDVLGPADADPVWLAFLGAARAPS